MTVVVLSDYVTRLFWFLSYSFSVKSFTIYHYKELKKTSIHVNIVLTTRRSHFVSQSSSKYFFPAARRHSNTFIDHLYEDFTICFVCFPVSLPLDPQRAIIRGLLLLSSSLRQALPARSLMTDSSFKMRAF